MTKTNAVPLESSSLWNSDLSQRIPSRIFSDFRLLQTVTNFRTPDLCGNQVGLRAAFDGKWCQENRSADSETRCVHSVYGFGRNFFLTPSDECGVMLFSAPGYREILATSLSTGSWDQAIEPEIRTSEFLNLCELSDSLPVCTSNVGHPCQMSKNTMGFEQSL